MPPRKKSATKTSGSSKPLNAAKSTGKRARSPEPAVANVEGSKRAKTSVPIDEPHIKEDISANAGGPPPPNFTGNFDLYSHRLGFLSEVYRPQGSSTPQYQNLYQKILSFQAKADRTVQIYLGAENTDTSEFYGQPYDPMSEEPLDDVILKSIQYHENLVLPKAKGSLTSSDSRPGISASIALGGGHCGIQSLSGSLKMSRLWTKPVGDGNHVELYEGHITYKISYSGLYRRKGHGSGGDDSYSFWAVRAKAGADGFEVGIREGIAPIVVNSSVSAVVRHPSSGKPAAIMSSTTALSEGASQAPDFSGKFKLYGMSDLVKHGLEIRPFPPYNKIYDYIVNNEPEVALKCSFSPTEDLEYDGYLCGPDAKDPFYEAPFKFGLTSIERQDSLSFTDDETGELIPRDESLDPTGPGAIIQLELAGEHVCPSVHGATGTIKFIRAWASANAEVYEAYLEYEVGVDPKAYRKLGNNYQYSYRDAIGYWAIRAGEDEEEGEDSDEEEDGCCGY